MIPKLPRLRVKHHPRKPDSYWFDHGGTPRHWERLGTDEAVVLRRYEVLMAASKPEPDTVDKMLADALEDMRKRKTVKPSTLANYKGYRKHLQAVFRDHPNTISQADVLQYLDECPRKSFRNEIGLLSLAFAHWMRLRRIDTNPCFGVHNQRKGSKRLRLLTDAEVDRIVLAADPRLAVAIEIACATGSRISELCAMRWTDLAAYQETDKTGQRKAYAEAEWFTALLARAKALQPRIASLYVICDRRGRQVKDNTLREHWDAACKRAGVEDAHFHDLRAYGATEVNRRGGDAQSHLGHRDARTTAIYLRDRAPKVVTPFRRKSSTKG